MYLLCNQLDILFVLGSTHIGSVGANLFRVASNLVPLMPISFGWHPNWFSWGQSFVGSIQICWINANGLWMAPKLAQLVPVSSAWHTNWFHPCQSPYSGRNPKSYLYVNNVLIFFLLSPPDLYTLEKSWLFNRIWEINKLG